MDCQKIKINTWMENKINVLRIAEQNTKGEIKLKIPWLIMS